ncbi:MAG: phosphatidylserine decarboxylase [Luteitalea sp.]|nr:phosphatidylserine decarboxylase [Luteitalea sp.]
MGWFSRIEHPLLCRASMVVWQRFGGDLNLHEAKKSRFSSLHDCFVRELKEGARPIDSRPEVLVSPCDAIVVASGRVEGTELIQAKGLTYTLDELLVDPALAELHRDGVYVTLRLRSNMYHRFHAPGDCDVDEVIYVAGDTWNVNPIALRRIERLYCKNERAILRTRLRLSREPLTLVPIAAILVASIQLHVLDVRLDVKYGGPNRIPCRASFEKGEELGYFHHGSTIIVLASGDVTICDHIREGGSIRMGQPLLRREPR